MLTYNIELDLTEEQRSTYIGFLETYRNMVNDTYKVVFDLENRNNMKLIHDACYKKNREKYPDMAAQTAIRAEREVISTFKSIRSNKHHITEAPIKKKLSMRLDKCLYSKFTKESIRLVDPTKKGYRITAKFKLYDKINELFSKYKPLDPLVFSRDNRIFLSISFNVPELPEKDDSSLGIDLGIKRLVATSDGLLIKGKEFIKHKRKIRYNKRMLQSKRTKSSKRHLKRLGRRERNFSKNYTHHIANQILKTDKSILVMEDLSSLKKPNRGKKFNNKLSQIPFRMLRDILTYKAPHIGKNVVTVNPANTSKNDYRGLDRGTRQGCRYYAVDGKVFDSDINAAINILHRHSKHDSSFVEPIDGFYRPRSQGCVNDPIVTYNTGSQAGPFRDQ